LRLFDAGGSPCGECIADRRGNKMPVLCGGNSVEILNPDLLIMSDRSFRPGAVRFRGAEIHRRKGAEAHSRYVPE